jgi:hypothetical protein
MANLNLSQFTEKTLVADADWVFVWDTAGAISKKVSRNSLLNSGTLATSAPVTISQTWNDAAVAFKALVVNAAGSSAANSASGSLLLDLQAGGVSQFAVTKVGTINFGQSQAAFDPYISKVASGTLAISLYGFNQNHVSLGYNGAGSGAIGVSVSSGGAFAWSSSSTNSEATRDTILVRDSASGNTLALRNSTAAQTFNVYGTYTSGSVYERMFARYNASDLAFEIGTQQAGATARPLILSANGSKRITLEVTGSEAINAYSYGNNSTNILALRTLNTVAKYQFYVNSSGKSELYVGTLGALISESGLSYFNGGNVGIGTTAPAEKLHVLGGKVLFGDAADTTGTAGNGDLTLQAYRVPQLNLVCNQGSNNFFGLNLKATSTTLGGIVVNASTGELRIGATSVSYFPTFYSNNAEIMRISTAGNVGIGTTAPSSKLEVYLNPANNYTTETVKFGNIHFANGTGGYSNLWMGSISTPLTLSATNYTLANDGTNTIINGGSGGLFFHVGAQAHWNIQNSTGHFLCASDNSRDIGASGANRPRNVYVGSRITCADFLLGSSAYFTATANGRLLLQNSSATDFDRLQLGGTADTFPAIARDGAGIKFTGAAAGLTSHIKVPAVAVSSLPSAATAGVGARAFVNDATSPVFGSAVTGGGSVPVPVYSTGSAWNVG